MLPFLCKNDHLAFLVTAGLFLRPSLPAKMEMPNHRAWQLRQQNLVSIKERHFNIYTGYTHEKIAADLSGEAEPRYTLETYHQQARYFQDQRVSLVEKIAQVCKALQSYVEQSTGDQSWQTSTARDYCDNLRLEWLKQLPGYDAAAYGCPRPSAAQEDTAA